MFLKFLVKFSKNPLSWMVSTRLLGNWKQWKTLRKTKSSKILFAVGSRRKLPAGQKESAARVRASNMCARVSFGKSTFFEKGSLVIFKKSHKGKFLTMTSYKFLSHFFIVGPFPFPFLLPCRISFSTLMDCRKLLSNLICCRRPKLNRQPIGIPSTSDGPA